jgi:hypothetical protein
MEPKRLLLDKFRAPKNVKEDKLKGIVPEM